MILPTSSTTTPASVRAWPCAICWKQGHTSIVCITGQIDKPTTQQRLDGVRDALGEQGLTLRIEQIFEGDYESQSGYDADAADPGPHASPDGGVCL